MDPLSKLAIYLTDGRRVSQASIGLEVGGEPAATAREFFDLRTAFGVEGYMSAGEALTAIQNTLEKS